MSLAKYDDVVDIGVDGADCIACESGDDGRDKESMVVNV